jgi:hypothetical protein
MLVDGTYYVLQEGQEEGGEGFPILAEGDAECFYPPLEIPPRSTA